ncbi:MAG: DUF411 domain-containing protein [Candidatus Thiodiazotropha endolucinida]|nr:DUF411 domain-containing protein [Candidatus Thiodiazotropha endolucinida]
MSKQLNKEMSKKPFLGKQLLWILGGIVLLGGVVMTTQAPAEAADVVVYKSPSCGCCKEWVKHMRDHGFSVEVNNRNDVSPIKKQMGVPGNLQSCHTAKVGDYVVEGHVPASDIKRLLKEKPDVVGLTAPGMPHGSPGMDMGPRKDPYNVLTFQRGGKTTVFSRHNQ